MRTDKPVLQLGDKNYDPTVDLVKEGFSYTFVWWTYPYLRSAFHITELNSESMAFIREQLHARCDIEHASLRLDSLPDEKPVH